MPTDPGRFIRGWLTLELSGEHPERLLDLALRQGLALREVQWLEPGRLLAQLDRDDLRQLTALARRCRVRVRVRRRQGLPFLLKDLRRRPLLPLAALLFLPLLAFLCSIVAEVSVTSPEPLDPREAVLVSQLAREAGVTAGRCRWTMDLEAAEKHILQGFPRLIYAEILRHGNRLEIAVVRRIDVAEEEKIRPPGDLVAACGGVIVDVLVQRGTACVSSGDRVQPGQVLISGDWNGDYVGAVGIVTARVFGAGYGECYQQQVKLVPTGRSRQQAALARPGGEPSLLLGRSRPFLLEQAACSRQGLRLWRKITLPVEIILIEFAELYPQRSYHSPEQAEAAARIIAGQRALRDLQQAGCPLLEVADFTEQPLDLGDGVSRCRVTAQALAEIGRFRPAGGNGAEGEPQSAAE